MDGIVCVVLWNTNSEQRCISFPVSFVGNSGPVAFAQKPNKYSPQEFDGTRILGCFLEDHKFGPGRGMRWAFR
jgi:hypothetical protein